MPKPYTSHIKNGLLLMTAAVFLFLSPLSTSAQEAFTVDDAPDVLSVFHENSPGLKSCSKCHNQDLEVVPGLCLACHQEIASRISEGRGYHRDKGEDCAVCHAEHQGKEGELVVFDPDDFDHAETGFLPKGAHKDIKECRACHREDNTISRKYFRSYLLKAAGCRACHTSPHPLRQETCLACHTQKNWRVDIWLPGGLR